MVLDGAAPNTENHIAEQNHVQSQNIDAGAAPSTSNHDNLANPPQNDVAAAGSDKTNTHAPATLASQAVVPPSASPGTDPAQQQKAMQPPNMQQPQVEQHQQTLQQTTQQPDALQKSGHQQQSSQGGLPRATKGKYSLADFDILRTLGTGSFGRVHLVQSKHNQRFYAVKVLKKAQVVKMKQVEHTNDERRMLSDVKHPFLITLWGTFVDTKNLYMVMDFVEDGELFSLLRKSGVCISSRIPNGQSLLGRH